MKLPRQIVLFIFILIIVSTVVKIFCAPRINLSGFTAIISVSLFSGLTISDKKLAFLLPLLTVFLSDVLIQSLYMLDLFLFPGFYSGQVINYILLVVLTLLAMGLRNLKTAGIVAAAFIGPTVFFLLSNFFVWKTQATVMGYNADVSGLWQSYSFGLPFYRNSLISTFIFLPAFIALYNRILIGRFSLKQVQY